MITRKVKKLVQGFATEDGAGVKLIRVFSKNDVESFDPFLMLDAFGSDNYEDYIKGFPMHPHRGIETITYLLEGEIIHKDSLGHDGSIESGELQWMTAGSGILHEEMPQPTPKMEGLQFWLNLPAKDKMTKPAYLSITKDMIKNIIVDKGIIKLIAGEYNGVKAVVPKFVDVTMMDIELEANGGLMLTVDPENTVFCYIFKGGASFGDINSEVVDSRNAVLFDAGDTVKITAGDFGVRLVMLSGKALGEPIAWGGPIVMNTREELSVAFDDLDNGTFIK